MVEEMRRVSGESGLKLVGKEDGDGNPDLDGTH